MSGVLTALFHIVNNYGNDVFYSWQKRQLPVCMYFVFEIHLEKSILYFVFSEPIQKYLVKVFQIHIFKSILYFVFEQRKKSIFYNPAYIPYEDTQSTLDGRSSYVVPTGDSIIIILGLHRMLLRQPIRWRHKSLSDITDFSPIWFVQTIQEAHREMR